MAAFLTAWLRARTSHRSIYLNDHLAGATVGVELARRAAASNRGSELGTFLETLAREVREDRESLIALMRALEIDPDRAKVALGWTAEKLGRVKLNGQLVGYSPLSRLIELEGLALGVRGKLSLWTALKAAGIAPPASAAVDLEALERRAEAQLRALEEHRLAAAAAVLA